MPLGSVEALRRCPMPQEGQQKPVRFNPPPSWPAPPQGWVPPAGWQPDSTWPPMPAGWQLYIEADSPSGPPVATSPPVATDAARLRHSEEEFAVIARNATATCEHLTTAI